MCLITCNNFITVIITVALYSDKDIKIGRSFFRANLKKNNFF